MRGRVGHIYHVGREKPRREKRPTIVNAFYRNLKRIYKAVGKNAPTQKRPGGNRQLLALRQPTFEGAVVSFVDFLRDNV